MNIQDVMNGCLDTVLHQLPADVRQFANDHCDFIYIERDVFGMTFHPAKHWVIVLNAELPLRYQPKEAFGIIAHEIAHAWLRHYADVPASISEPAAAAQAAAWGFIGIGATPPNEQ